MKRNIKSHKGFTLVEMLGVLAIIAILISVISVGVLAAINRARIVSTLSNFKNLETATLSYIALNESSGKLPLTKSFAALPAAAGFSGSSGTASIATGNQTALHLETVFVAAGTLEKYPAWRVGNDPLQNGIRLDQEQGWNRKLNRWSTWATGTSNGPPTAANNWSPYVRAECAMSDPTVLPGAYNANGMMGSGSGVNFRLDGSSNLPLNVRVAYVVIPGLTAKDAEKISEEINGTLNDMDLRANPAAVTQTRGRFVTDGATQAGDINGLVGYYLLDTF